MISGAGDSKLVGFLSRTQSIGMQGLADTGIRQGNVRWECRKNALTISSIDVLESI